jgi:argininosuccinate lyase
VLRQFAPQIDADALDVLGVDGSLAARNHVGGTAPEQVRAAVQRARAELSR